MVGLGVGIAVIQYLGFTPGVVTTLTAIGGLLIAVLSFWIISEKRSMSDIS